MTKFPERLPAPLSERIAAATDSIYSRQGREVEVAIGGIPFRLATSQELPYSIDTVNIRKDQVDTEQDPGEQSLSGWWRRSQSSFHAGAGSRYQEDSTQLVDSNTFWESEGVDVFSVRGRTTLLKKMVQNATAGPFRRVRLFGQTATRTNLSLNPSFEANTTSWATTGATPPTLTRTATGYVGDWHGRVAWANSSTTSVGVSHTSSSITSGTIVTLSVYVYVESGPAVQIVSNMGNSAASTTTGQWERLSVTGTQVSTGSANFNVQPVTPPSSGQAVRVDAALVEASGIVGSYFDGNTTGASWTGTTNNSTSTLTSTISNLAVNLIKNGQLWTASDQSGSVTSLHAPVGKTLVDGVITGSNFYDVATDGTLYEGTVASPGTATTWPLTSTATGTPSRLAWGKHRLWVIGGRNIWQPNLSLAGGSNQAPIWTNPNKGWTYTCLAEGPAAMFFGGNDGNSSSIQAITFDSGGGIPTLTGAQVTAVLPNNELVQEIDVLGGQYVGIGTSHGFRVGTINADSSITYGPLIIEPDSIEACTSITTQGRYFVVGFRTTNGKAKVYRVDTGTELDGGVFPYASDADLGFTGYVESVAGGRPGSSGQLVAVGSDNRLYYMSPTDYVSSGYLETGRIRYRTTERKFFRSMQVEVEPLLGSLGISLFPEGGGLVTVGTLSEQGLTFPDRMAITAATPVRYVSIKFTLAPPVANPAATPTLNSYQVSAQPAVKPQRSYTVPLLCYDQEQALSGQWYGGKGFASDRYNALLSLEDQSSVVTYQDFGLGDTGRLVTIESVRFVRFTTAPVSAGAVKGPGGVILLELRTAED